MTRCLMVIVMLSVFGSLSWASESTVDSSLEYFLQSTVDRIVSVQRCENSNACNPSWYHCLRGECKDKRTWPCIADFNCSGGDHCIEQICQ